jgi:hypothetical protein
MLIIISHGPLRKHSSPVAVQLLPWKHACFWSHYLQLLLCIFLFRSCCLATGLFATVVYTKRFIAQVSCDAWQPILATTTLLESMTGVETCTYIPQVIFYINLTFSYLLELLLTYLVYLIFLGLLHVQQFYLVIVLNLLILLLILVTLLPSCTLKARQLRRICSYDYRLTYLINPCGGGVEYLHRDLESRKRRRNGTKKRPRHSLSS